MSEVISIGIPPVNVNENKPEEKKEESIEHNKPEDKKEENKSEDKKEENSSIFLSEVISIGIPPENVNENKPEDKKEEKEENKEDKPKKEIEDSQQNLDSNKNSDKNDNIEIIIEKKDDNNKTQELFSDNKEKENLKDSEINLSNILNSNLSMNNDTNKKPEEEEEKKNENDEKKNSINVNEQKPRKSLFDGLFTSQNNELDLDKLMNPNQLSNIFDKENNNKESLFSNDNINNEKKEKKEKENIFTNNQGKSILSSDDNFELLGSKMTPIKSVNLFQNQNNIENKDNKETINDNNEQKDEKEDEEISIDIKAENSENNENNEKQNKKEEASEEKKENSLINSNNNINIDNDNGENGSGSGSVLINLNKNKDNNNQKIIEENIKLQNNISKNEELVLSADEEEYNPKEIIKKENPEVSSLQKRKPLNKKIYSGLIEKMYRITEKEKNDIDVPEKKTVTLYDNTLSKFLKDFEDKIKNLKNLYIITIIKRGEEKGHPKKQDEIVLEANVPKKRNELKKLYKNMMNVIKNKLQKENKKYYYILILKILDKYKKITPKEQKEKKNAYMKMKEKEIIKNKKIQKDKEKEKDKEKKLEQKKSYSTLSNLVKTWAPLICIPLIGIIMFYLIYVK